MGKSVKNTDPFAFKPEYNEQVTIAAPAADPNDAFSYKPEYNADVKKKIGGTASEIGITEPSPTASESQSKKETATDFLINDINKNDFFSDLAANTDRYFPNTTPQRVNQQAAEMTQKEVFRNPESLQRYAATRVNKIREEIKNIEREKFQLKDFTYADQLSSFDEGFITDPKKYDELAQQAREKQSYINQFKNNVADVAAGLIVAQQDLTKVDPRQVGREIVRIADPDQEEIFAMAEAGGKTLPGIRREELSLIGINALKQYLSRNPDIPNYEEAVRAVNDMESDLDERNFEITGQRVREKIGAQIYKEGRGSFFGFGYSPSVLQEVADNPSTGLTESEKKIFKNYVLPIERRIIGTNIPTSGFTKSMFNAIEKGAVNAGKSLGDVTGLRDESDQAQDILNREIEESRFRPAGESPTAQAQLAYLQQKEKKDGLTDGEKKLKTDLENYTYVRNGWSKFKDGVGDLTGQVAMIALTTKGLGAAGKALSASGEAGGLLGGLTRGAIGTALSNETVGLFLSSYLNAYDNYKQQAIELMPGEDQAANRDAYATVMSAVEGLSERIFRDTKILNAFTKNVSPAIRTITDKFISREITQQVAREETEKTLSSALKSFGKEYAKATGQESTEEAVVDFANGMARAVFGGQEFDIVKTGQQALNTFLTTALYSPLVAGMSATGSTRQQRAENSFMKSAIVDMAANPAQYLQSIEDLQTEGTITQQQANEKIKLVKSASKYLQEIPSARSVSRTVGEGDAAVEISEEKSFDYPEVSSYLLHRLNEGILNEQINESTDEVLKSQLQKKLKRSEEIRKGLFDGSVSVTPDLREVTDNPEEAAELGIFDAAKLPADDLIGTPFERGTQKVSRETERETTENQQQNEEEPEVENAPAPPIQGQAAPAEITEDQKASLINRAAEAATMEMNPDYAAVFTKNVEVGLREAAQQLNATGSEAKTARELYGPTISDIAVQLFPDERPPEMSSEMEASLLEDDDAEVDFPIQKIETDEKQIKESGSQEAAETEEGSAENAAEETVLNQQGAEPAAEAPLTEEKTIAQKGKEIADKIRSLKTRRDVAQANIFGIGVGIYDGAIETIATAVEQGAALADAINRGIRYIRDNGGDKLDEENFRQHIEDQAAGKKPKIKVQVGEEAEPEEKKPSRPKKERKESEPGDEIGDYKMTTSGEVNRFLSGATWADVFGEAPEGNQQYETQRLSDMLQDGQNMIAIAQGKWGGDVMMYAKPLFQFIQGLSDAETTNKKAVLLATLLGELQEAKLRSPERFEAIQQLERAVFAYYQSFMNQRGKEIVAARLLRLYRDKYIGDIYTDQILDEDQARAKKKMQAAEQNKNIDDVTAEREAPPVTPDEKKKEDTAAKKKTDAAKKDRSKKTKMSTTEAQQRAGDKIKDIEGRLGKEGKSGLIDKIKEAIKKLNCK
jgi:hypothetical protein